MSTNEVHLTINTLTAGNKYELLTKHIVPDEGHSFSLHSYGKQQRSFNRAWLQKHPWLVYSFELDAAFCLNCVLFAKSREHLGQLVNSPFTNWKRALEKFADHEKNEYHHTAAKDAKDFIYQHEHPMANIPVMLDERRAANIVRNTQILKCIIQVFCGKQCIALRGSEEKLDTPGNQGNFLAILKLMLEHNSVLREHLHRPQFKNATYLSTQIQNEIIDIVGNDIILKPLVVEILKAKIFSILADEVTVHNIEQLILCIRFVDKLDIREEFIKFARPPRVTGQCLSYQIKAILRELGLPIENIRGQGYDGAASMSSKKVGVQARIKEDAPNAVFVHCNGHCLNLVISRSCAIPMIRNNIGRVTSVSWFFNCSPKRNGLLEAIFELDENDRRVLRILLDMCRTRWAARHIAYRHFHQAYLHIVKALEIIANGIDEENLNQYADERIATDWDSQCRGEASGLLTGITTFEFIMVFWTVYQLLSHLHGVTVKLQGKSIDIIHAHQMVSLYSRQCIYV